MRHTSVNVVQRHVFCHSPESWTELWDGEIFEKGTVRVETELIAVNRGGDIAHWMKWSVTRL